MPQANASATHQVPDSAVVTATYAFFAVLSVLCLAIHQLALKTKSHVTAGNNEHFQRFQRRYFAAYFLAMLGDWLQGPYVYKLYSHYGFVESQIAALYVAGFGASVLFGTVTGSLADRFGRKCMCILFCLLYSLCCLTKISSSYYVLMLGRVLGGISTSLLFSSFESWYVHEHIQTHDFPKEWISLTFSKATFWNGVLAIAAGVLANATSEWLNLGPVSPFLTAVPFLLMCGLVISRAWRENYGDTSSRTYSPIEGLRRILDDEKIFLLGIIQSIFESAMYIFVFLWTPVLDPTGPPLGLVFSVFMVCIMIGSTLYRLLSAWHVSSQQVLLLASVIATLAMCLCVVATNPSRAVPLMAYVGFLMMELSLGMYFPAIGYLKSQVIPEMQRASIMNWLRVPLNVIACGALLWLHSEHTGNGNRIIFTFSAVAMFLSVLVIGRFCRLYRQKGEVTLM